LYRKALGRVRGSPGTCMVTEVIEALRIAAVAVGQVERGVRLLGASEAQRERIGLRFLMAMTRSALEPALAAARAALGDSAFDAAWDAGRTLRPAQAVAEALEPFVSPTGPPGTLLTPRETESSGCSPRGSPIPTSPPRSLSAFARWWRYASCYPCENSGATDRDAIDTY
jgi:hypothetical protein